MPYRTFADDQGKSWEIWEVRPARVERRAAGRAADRREISPTLWAGIERRVEGDRRRKLDGRLDPSHPLAHGWLVFKSEDEKRRLAPIPLNWETCRGRELRELWERAQVTPGKMEKSA